MGEQGPGAGRQGWYTSQASATVADTITNKTIIISVFIEPPWLMVWFVVLSLPYPLALVKWYEVFSCAISEDRFCFVDLLLKLFPDRQRLNSCRVHDGLLS